jgi:hypothetical protein
MRMASRRRNPKGGRRLAAVADCAMEIRIGRTWEGRRMQSAGHDARIHFSAAC